jgi:hypothetical protein
MSHASIAPLATVSAFASPPFFIYIYPRLTINYCLHKVCDGAGIIMDAHMCTDCSGEFFS